MLILLPFLLIIGLFLLYKNYPFNGFRVSILKSLIAYSVFVFIITELLGNLYILNGKIIVSSYILLICIVYYYLFQKQILSFRSPFLLLKIFSHTIVSFFSKSVFAFFLVIILTLFFLTLFVTPNNTDALGYHLARTMFWIQHQNLFHFPTTIPFQLYYNVFSEYLLLHTIVLAGSDRFVNSIQFIAFLGTLIATSLIGKNFGLSQKGQGLVAIIACTVPMGILQATTSQNDNLASFYFCTTLYFGLLVVQNQKKPLKETFQWAILSLMLAGFTKYSIFMYCSGFIVFIALYLLKTDWKKALKVGFISLGLFLITFGAFFYRNYVIFKNILMPNPKSMLYYNYRNEEVSIKVTLSNLSKIVGNHIGLPINSWNESYDKLITKFHLWLGYDLNNMSSTFASYYTIFSIGEDFSGNFIHFILISISLCWFFLNFRKKEGQHQLIFIYFILLFVGIIVYASVFKWQLFHSRTQLPFFMASTPVIGYVIWQISKNYRWLMNFFAMLLLIASLPYVYCNSLKPILPMAYYFKKMFVYVPPILGENEEALNKELYKKLVERGLYQPNIVHFTDKVYSISPDITFTQRKEIFKLLDSTSYYNFIRHNIFEIKEWKQGYFTFDNKAYQDFKHIFAYLRESDFHVGLASNTSWIHPFFMFGRAKFGDKFKLSYIQYPQDLQYCYNAKKIYSYTAIITDDSTIVNKIASQTISAKKFGAFYVLQFQNPMKTVFLQ